MGKSMGWEPERKGKFQDRLQATGAGKEWSQTTEWVPDTEGVPRAQSAKMPCFPQDERTTYVIFMYNFNVS